MARRRVPPIVTAEDFRREDEDTPAEPVELPITDVLDLHSFPPEQVPDLVRDWLDEVCVRGYREVRIIHGRGIGVQRRTVRAILRSDSRVAHFADAPPGAGGWGATVIRLEPA
jgi:dsDNA-specific endonuclease/ATPase MutS2